MKRNLQVRDVAATIKSAARLLDEDDRQYGSQSLKVGIATALFYAGFDSLAVCIFGRWRSDAVVRFTTIIGRLTSKMTASIVVNMQ